jgi:hypothetical protein
MACYKTWNLFSLIWFLAFTFLYSSVLIGAQFWYGLEAVTVRWEWRDFHKLPADKGCKHKWFGKIFMCSIECRDGVNHGSCCEWYVVDVVERKLILAVYSKETQFLPLLFLLLNLASHRWKPGGIFSWLIATYELLLALHNSIGDIFVAFILHIK